MKLFLNIIIFMSCFVTVGMCTDNSDDGFDSYSRNTTSQSDAAQQISNEIKDCTEDMKQGWASGAAKGGVLGGIYEGASAGIDCVTQQVKNFGNNQDSNK